jgi:hypothetical protein
VITTFSSPLRPAPAFYGGGGLSDLVPWKFDVAIAGRPYMLDLASNQYQEGWEPRIRDSVDQSNIPGESTISPQGLWRRSQNSWHLGAGQRWADLDDSQYGRFYKSVGVDVFSQKGEIRLLPTGNLFQPLLDGILPSTFFSSPVTVNNTNATNLFIVQTANRVYWSENKNVFYANRISPREPGIYQQVVGFGLIFDVTGTPNANVTGLSTDGFHVFISYGANGIYLTNQGSSAATQFVSGTAFNAGISAYVKGRLMVAGNGSEKNKLWNITTSTNSTANNPAAMYTHPNSDFTWAGFAAGPNHIYAAGRSGAHSIIYRTQIKADGSSLDAPIAAGELPHSEIVSGFDSYLGFVLIGTRDGVRLATADANGDLVIGSLIRTDGEVTSFASDRRFVYFAWNNHPSGRQGTGVLDLSQFTGPNTPAYASYIYNELNPVGGTTSTSDKVVDMIVCNGLLMYTVEKHGICMTQREGIPVDEGYLDTGAWVWGIPDPKILAKIDGRHAALQDVDAVKVGVSADDGPFQICNCVSGRGSPFTTFNPQQQQSFKYDLRIYLYQKTILGQFAGPNSSPKFNRINARAFVNPARSQVIRLPLLLHSVLNVNGEDVAVDTKFELLALRSLVRNAQITNLQDADGSFRVLVEDVLWIPDNNRSVDRKWAGTAVVTMRSIDD